VTNAVDPGEFKVVEAMAARNGLDVSFAGGAQPTLSAKARAMTGDLRADEPLLWDLLENGLLLESELWWRVYSLAQTALAPDSVVSRRHAGPIIVNDDGSIIGRKDSDDETDVSFLITPLDKKTKAEGVGQ
jgi:hypothetical protein